MDSLQPTLAALIVGVLLSLSGCYGWKHLRNFRRLRAQRDLPPADRRYHLGQVCVGLTGSLLMVVLAGLVGGSYLLGLEKRADQLPEEAQAQAAEGEKPALDPEQREFLNRYTTLWSAALLVLMLLLLLAAYDLWAIRRYGLRHHRQIQEDRREMIKKELTLFRTQRNGHT